MCIDIVARNGCQREVDTPFVHTIQNHMDLVLWVQAVSCIYPCITPYLYSINETLACFSLNELYNHTYTECKLKYCYDICIDLMVLTYVSFKDFCTDRLRRNKQNSTHDETASK